MYLIVNGFSKSESNIKRTPVEPPLSDNDKISDLRARVASIINRPEDGFVLMYCGKILQDGEETLASINIRVSSSSVHVFPKACKDVPCEEPIPKVMTEDEMSQFMMAFGMAIRNPSFNRVVQRMKHKESLENLVAACPELAKDPIGCAFLSKPELLINLMNLETLKYMMGKHPGIIEAANNLAAAVHEERVSEVSPAEEIPGPFAYNLDEMSDDDDDEDMEMAMAQHQQHQQQQGRAQNRPIITTDQLAAALAAAHQNSLIGGVTGLMGNQPRPNPRPVIMPPPQSLQSNPGPSGAAHPPRSVQGGFITHDQLAAALAATSSMLAESSKSPASQSQTPAGIPPPPTSSGPNLEASIATMKEMGIGNEGLARKALILMGGDLQAAIDLILTGWSGDDESTN